MSKPNNLTSIPKTHRKKGCDWCLYSQHGKMRTSQETGELPRSSHISYPGVYKVAEIARDILPQQGGRRELILESWSSDFHTCTMAHENLCTHKCTNIIEKKTKNGNTT